MKNKLPYDQRSDLHKVEAQWTKLTGLHGRREWSEAVVRAATAAELAANFAIRQEFADKSTLPPKFVDGLLVWANGLHGKMKNLLIPLTRDKLTKATHQKLLKLSESVNADRNKIVHRGEFRGENESRAIIEETRDFIETIVRVYKSKYRLKEKHE